MSGGQQLGYLPQLVPDDLVGLFAGFLDLLHCFFVFIQPTAVVCVCACVRERECVCAYACVCVCV